jgi:hypothetical protein
MPNDAWRRPAVSARSMKKGPKLCVARSTVPSAGFRRYRKAPDEVATGSVARLARSAFEIVSLVASAAARSRSMLSVATDSLVTRNVSTSETVCARAGAALRRRPSASRPRGVLFASVVIIFSADANVGRLYSAVRLGQARP